MTESVSAIILAGGQGSRMNFQNKGLLMLNGQPLIQHVIDRLSNQVDEIIISANDRLDEYLSLGYRVVSDPGQSVGPLSGMDACASSVQHSLVLVVPCDMPNLPTTLVSSLKPHLLGDAVYVLADNRKQPLVSLMKHQVLTGIKEYLGNGGRSVMGWLEAIPANVMEWNPDDNQAFQNINSLGDIEDVANLPKR